MLNWCNRFNICCFLDNHNYHLPHHSVECLVAAGMLDAVSCSAGNAFQHLYDFDSTHPDWLFGHFSYDLKNELEELSSSNPDRLGFPGLFFFVPEYLLQVSSSTIIIGSFNNDHEKVWKQITNEAINPSKGRQPNPVVHSRYTQQEYVATVEAIRRHILRGDCYEINFCQEFYSDNITASPGHLYARLSEVSPSPFSAFYKHHALYAFCMSPERYLKKEGKSVLSQPMKGTAARVAGDEAADRLNAELLADSEKERAENIMVVDLVRNDLSKVSVEGSVKVDELCSVYSFPQVHQMISTVSGNLRDNIHWTEVIKATFPMGSMTGAPKKKVMELIEKFERTKRGLFSGSIGYVTPERDFDFNVVIRSVLYNAATKYLSFHTGSAITYNCNPEKEYEECLLKASAIKKALAETNTFH